MKKIFVRFLLVVIIAGGIWSFLNYQQIKNRIEQGLPTSEESSQEQDQAIIEKIGRIMLLPQEVPQIALINNIDELKASQPDFFKNAMNGDYVLVYTNKAIIYRENENKLINVGSVYATPQSETTTENEKVEGGTEEEIQEITIEIRNGSRVAGAAAQLRSEITSMSESYDVIAIGDAAVKNYPDTVIVNLSGKNLSSFEELLDASIIHALPAGEKESDADMVIIIGTDE